MTSSLLSAEREFYAGVSVGQAFVDPDTGNSGLLIDSDTDTGFKIYGGYDITNNFSIEGVWVDAGQATFQPTGFIDYKTMGIEGLYYYPGNDSQFRGFAKVGAGTIDNSSDQSFVRDSDANLIVGGGFEYDFGGLFSLRAEYEYFSADVQMISVGISKRFSLFSNNNARVTEPVDTMPDVVPTQLPVVTPVETTEEVILEPLPVKETIMVTQPYKGQRVLLEKTSFITGSPTLKSSAYPELDTIADDLFTDSDAKVTITGFAENTDVRKLTLLKARSVAKYLHNKGVSKDRIRFTVAVGGDGEVQIVTR